MKKATTVLLVLVLAFVVIGCGTGGNTGPALPSNVPQWLNEFPPEDALWGVGSSAIRDDSQAMQFAENSARVAIARQLDTKVQAMMTDYFLQAGGGDNPATTSLKENVSRSITNMNVSGARPIKREKIGNTWWYLVEMKKADAKGQITSMLRNEEAQYAQFKAQQALDMLDQQLAKSENAGTYQVSE